MKLKFLQSMLYMNYFDRMRNTALPLYWSTMWTSWKNAMHFMHQNVLKTEYCNCKLSSC